MTTVYGQPSCPPCKAATRLLDRLSIPYRYVDISTDRDALTHIISLGHNQTPVVINTPEDHWSGYRPERISSLAT